MASAMHAFAQSFKGSELCHPYSHVSQGSSVQPATHRPCVGSSTSPLMHRGRHHVVQHALSTAYSQANGWKSVAPAPVPHAGYHFDGTNRRFFEGWYWKVTDQETGASFALIFSVEDPAGGTHTGVGVQVMGPDGYICQFSSNTRALWADRNRLILGATLQGRTSSVPRSMVSEAEFNRCVLFGFQASTTIQQGSIMANELGASGPAMSTVQNCSWNLAIQPVSGWGPSSSAGGGQKATAGWLSALTVFEPHWQVLNSHGLANGWVQWGDRRYEFAEAPTYAEKNWGGGFPSKWHWIQCNTWTGQPGLSVTAVGARRALLLGAQAAGIGEEDVGLIGVTLPNGSFIELVPWNGELDWDVDPWGRWYMRAVSAEYEAIIEATCTAASGVVLRAPTIAEGLTPFCKDSFEGKARLRVWRLGAGGAGGSASGAAPFLEATSDSAAVEVGGGPWWAAWAAKAAMREPFRTLVQLPIDVKALGSFIPGPFRPPGL